MHLRKYGITVKRNMTNKIKTNCSQISRQREFLDIKGIHHRYSSRHI